MIGTYGPVTFSASADLLRTFDNLTRSGSARYAEHNTLNGKPRLEFIGSGLDDVSFDMRFDIQYGINPRLEIERLRAIKDTGQFYFLVLAGQPVGRFVIQDIGEDWRHIDGRGRLLVASVNVSMKEYVRGIRG